MTAVAISRETIGETMRRAQARLEAAEPEVSASSVAINEALRHARIQLENAKSEVAVALRTLASAVLSGSKRRKSVEDIRERIQGATDVIVALEQASAENERVELRGQAQRLEEDRKSLEQLRRECDALYDYMLSGTPTFSHEKTDELREVESARHFISVYIRDIDGRLDAIGRRVLEIAAVLEAIVAGAVSGGAPVGLMNDA